LLEGGYRNLEQSAQELGKFMRRIAEH